MEWKDARGIKKIELESLNTEAGRMLQLTIGGRVLPLLGHSWVLRENHGYGWLETGAPRWIGDGFLVFEDSEGLCLVDTSEKVILLNQIFTGFSKDPSSDRWAAIKYRALSRNQEKLTGSGHDILFFIEPSEISSRRKLSSEDQPFGHIPTIKLDGIALARPIWAEKGSVFTVPIFVSGNIEAVTFDAKSHKETGRFRIEGPKIAPVEALSPWFLPDVDKAVSRAIEEKLLRK